MNRDFWVFWALLGYMPAACSRNVLLAQYKYVRCGVNGRGAAKIWTALQSCMSNLLNGLCIHPWSMRGGHKGSHQARVRVRDNHFHFLKIFLGALQACHTCHSLNSHYLHRNHVYSLAAVTELTLVNWSYLARMLLRDFECACPRLWVCLSQISTHLSYWLLNIDGVAKKHCIG